MNELNASTVQLISSTQVITSIYSVVKELLENSLDALSENVEIKLEDGGLSQIELHDNGTGVPIADVPFLCKPHYTSKIKHESDLQSLSSYGFRGEALSAVCAVSNVSVITKTIKDVTSKLYVFDKSGEIVETKITHHNDGSIVIVQDLFKNVPVRRQFYQNKKRLKHELKIIEELLVSYSLLYPKLRLILRNNKTTLFEKHRFSSIENVISTLFGKKILQYLVEINIKKDNFQINGFIPALNGNLDLMTRSINDQMFLSVNNRPIKMKEITKLLKQLFVEYCCDGNKKKYPTAVIHLTVAPHLVDVNVEPNKTAVYLQIKDEILETFSDEIKKIYCVNSDKEKAEDFAILNSKYNENSVMQDINSNNNNEVSEVYNDMCLPNSNSNNASNVGIAIAQTSVEKVLPLSDDSITESLHATSDSLQASSLTLQDDSFIANLGVRNFVTPDITPNKNCQTVKIPENPAINCNVDDDFAMKVYESLESTSVGSDSINENGNSTEELMDCLLSPQTPELIDITKWSKGTLPALNVMPVEVLPKTSSINDKLKSLPYSNKTENMFKSTKYMNQSTAKEYSKQHPITNYLRSPAISSKQNSKILKNRAILKSEVCWNKVKNNFRMKMLPHKSIIKRVDDDMHVVGRVHSTSIWIIRIGKKLYAADKTRLTEHVLYENLLKRHQFNPVSVNKPVKLNENLLGVKRYCYLISKETECIEGYLGRFVKDSRFKDNGILIKKHANAGSFCRDVTFEISHLPDVLHVDDVLHVIDDSLSDPTCYNRPENIRDWLKAEAMRLSKLNSNEYSKTEFAELMKEIAEKHSLVESGISEFGNKPLLHELVTANDDAIEIEDNVTKK